MSLSKIYNNSQGFQADDLTSATEGVNEWVEQKFPQPKKTGFKQEEIRNIEVEITPSPAETKKKIDENQSKLQKKPKKDLKDNTPTKDTSIPIKAEPEAKVEETKTPETKPPINDNSIDLLEAKKLEDLAYQKGLEEGRKQTDEQAVEKAFQKGMDEGIAKGAADAKEDSYKKGKEEGINSIKNEFETATNALSSACTEIGTFQDKIASEYSSKIQGFAIDITEKLIHLSINNNDHIILSTLETALAKALKSSEITIFLNPEDFATVEEHKEDLISGISGLENIILKKDSSLEKGGANMESDQCVIDASISGQLELIYQELGLNNEK